MPNAEYLAAKVQMYERNTEAARAELERVLMRPVDDFEEGSIVTFQKGFGRSYMYTYCAIKAGGKWWMSGLKRPTAGTSWDVLLDFIESSETEMPIIRYMTEWKEL